MSAKVTPIRPESDPSTEPKRFLRVSSYCVLDKTTGIYIAKCSLARYRIPDLNKSTRERRVGRAKVIAEKLYSDHLKKYLGTDNPDSHGATRIGKSTAAVIDEVLEYITPKRRVRTQENHRLYLGELKRELGVYPISRITLGVFSEWLARFRLTKDRKTFEDYAKNMNLVLRYAYTQKYVSHLVSIPNPDGVKGETGRVYTESEIKALWKAMNEDTRDLFVLSYECIMRLREGLHLTWDRVDLEEGTITLRAQDVKTGSKTGKGRTFAMSPRAWSRMKARHRRSGASPFVFPSPENANAPVWSIKTAWRTAKRKAGIKGKARWHDLRHTALSRALLEQRMDPVLVSEYSGVSLRTLQRVYLHSTAKQTASVSKSVSVFNSSDNEE